MFEIEFYRTREGSCPMEAFLDSLDQRMAIKALQELTLLSEKGTDLREPHSKALGKGLFELRIKSVRTFHDASTSFEEVGRSSSPTVS